VVIDAGFSKRYAIRAGTGEERSWGVEQATAAGGVLPIHTVELVAPEALRPHPRNYRHHPVGQLEHLVASLERHGVYRNVATARDGTMLAGHGGVAAALELGLAQIPVVRLHIGPDDPQGHCQLSAKNLRISAVKRKLETVCFFHDRLYFRHLYLVSFPHEEGICKRFFIKLTMPPQV